MRQLELLQHLRGIISEGSFASHFQSIAGTPPVYVVAQLNSFRDKLERILTIPSLSATAEALYRSDPLRMALDQTTTSSSSFRELQSAALRLDISISALESYLKAASIDSPQDSLSVSIKLAKTKNLSEVAHTIERLDKVFNLCLDILEDPPVLEVKRWEQGSLWIDVAVSSAGGVFLLGGLAWSAACAFKKFQEGLILQKQAEAFGIKNEVLTAMGETAVNALNIIIDAEARRLDEKHSKAKGDPETIQRLSHSVREVFEMMKEGTEIHPALMAPEEVKNVFPNMSEVLGLPSVTKMLKDKSENEDSPQVGG